MTQNQARSACESLFPALSQEYLLERYPVIMPAALLTGAVGLCAASFYASSLFPLLTLAAIPAAPLCLSLAFVLGVAGILASIISILERIDRNHLRPATFPKEKGA